MLSIITPVFNGSKYLRKLLTSVNELEIQYEHILVDGGSTDGSQGIILEFENSILLHQKEKSGMYGALHQGICASKGDYVCWVNCDDRILAQGFKEMFCYARERKIDFISSDGYLIYENSGYRKSKFSSYYTRYLLKNGLFPFIQTSVIFSRRAYDMVGGFNYDRFKLIGDRDLFQRMAYQRELKFATYPAFSCEFIMRDDSLFYSNLRAVEAEREYTMRTNINWFHKSIYHMSQIIKRCLFK